MFSRVLCSKIPEIKILETYNSIFNTVSHAGLYAYIKFTFAVNSSYEELQTENGHKNDIINSDSQE